MSIAVAFLFLLLVPCFLSFRANLHHRLLKMRRWASQDPLQELRSLKEKNKMLCTLMKEKDERLKEKDERLREKDSTFAMLIKEKDEKASILVDLVARAKVDILRAQGLLNVRGLFECFVGLCHSELLSYQTMHRKQNEKKLVKDTINVKNTLDRIQNLPPDVDLNLMPTVVKILKYAEEGGLANLNSLYATLSDKVHGVSWREEPIPFHVLKLAEEEKFVLNRIFDFFHVRVEKVIDSNDDNDDNNDDDDDDELK